MIRISVDNSKTVLSSECRVYKTGRLVKDARRLAGTDAFLSALAEGIIGAFDKFFGSGTTLKRGGGYRLTTADGAHTFYFRFGGQTGGRLADKDIIFYRYEDREQTGRRNDQRFLNYLKDNPSFTAGIRESDEPPNEEDFGKLYLITDSGDINFPLLSAEQERLVGLEDCNVLVQGVAGSGKTNVCISKIIFAAGRGYSGKILYTTYSRGLIADTKNKVGAFVRNLRAFLSRYAEGRIVFVGADRKKAIENKLGIVFTESEEDKIVHRVGAVVEFLETKVDYFLISDLYERSFGKTDAADESYFLNVYAQSGGGRLAAARGDLPLEIVYKEIYGMIFGCAEPEAPQKTLSLEEYTAKREGSFTRAQCAAIYDAARDYAKDLAKKGLSDYNAMSRRLLAELHGVPRYSLAVIDEVQDFTEVALCLFKRLARKLFCVGDALQMINPSYFGFAYLKRLLYEKELTPVAELKHNYRNTKTIERIIERLGEINLKEFGTHSFVLKGKSVESDVPTSAVFIGEKGFLEAAAKEKADDVTIVVGSLRKKEELRRIFKNKEILTVSEIKGLERDAVILCDLLSDNENKWSALERSLVNRKKADENSVYRYYFNLFYVGVSRAKQYLYVYEKAKIPLFEGLFKELFEGESAGSAAKRLASEAGRLEVDDEELRERVREFLKLGQYANARFAAGKIADDKERTEELHRVDIAEQYLRSGAYREAGIRFWELGMTEDAKTQFTVSGDSQLVSLVEACSGEGVGRLDVSILRFFPELKENKAAAGVIAEAVRSDLARMRAEQKEINGKLRR